MAHAEPSGDCLVIPGADAGGVYATVTTDGRHRGSHRVVWEQHHGPIPIGMVVDHICANRACVNIAHLRLLSDTGNKQARALPHAKNTSGFRGVYLHKPSGRWRAQVHANGKGHYLGSFATPEEAAFAAVLGRWEHHEALSMSDLNAVALSQGGRLSLLR